MQNYQEEENSGSSSTSSATTWGFIADSYRVLADAFDLQWRSTEVRRSVHTRFIPTSIPHLLIPPMMAIGY